ncbi:cysteine--1-D-myo-inosityl 2-amino-2-deoxy-alpha-D-glucopyranoside ligase [Agrococcus sp. SL85]|uniref:cysteine--1-D-myo-inosityl 2-amino-2-deoxy-alpha-D-glucopyranoside ligase n=1 Tax=Agrococcus sp. SL85 TaxID=2995141 RepID=UPI00226D0912|nr:cysteine--1-D-myo-inosityl 2-amino-2-deoxy-alpha-D-glucopyranoside ligase [Agrococcus sp. SL85]WAC65937.1 cysteine--1-D-myo-inosityl 2-amino-2-deoxy-alpha-D-glucopyranoside ligase [Agrococcus sp. SL85]
MRAWEGAAVPSLDALGLGLGERPAVHDTKRDEPIVVPQGAEATMYTCGITPYDATHLGHAFTYLAFDTLTRVWLDAGIPVRTAMNSTDVDDPLLERAARDGVDWRALAEQQQQLFRDDMTALRILPPDAWIAVTERIGRIGDAVRRMLDSGDAYLLPAEGASEPGAQDVLFDTTRARAFPIGLGSRTDDAEMLALTREFGGDPHRPGKRSPLDPLLWRAERPGEPAWDSAVGRGRPGWHVECTEIAMDELGAPFTVAAGGRDLRFPHQELQAHHALALGAPLFSEIRMGAGLVAYQGSKMSKSLGNLVLVSRLREAGARPAAIRLALLAHRWRDDWEWHDDELEAAEQRLDRWAAWARVEGDDPSLVDSVVPWLRVTLAADLDTPAALQAIDDFVLRAPADEGSLAAIDALLGIDLLAVEPR